MEKIATDRALRLIENLITKKRNEIFEHESLIYSYKREINEIQKKFYKRLPEYKDSLNEATSLFYPMHSRDEYIKGIKFVFYSYISNTARVKENIFRVKMQIEALKHEIELLNLLYFENHLNINDHFSQMVKNLKEGIGISWIFHCNLTISEINTAINKAIKEKSQKFEEEFGPNFIL